MRILGIDPSIRSTGYGILELADGKVTKPRSITFGTIKNPTSRSHAQSLLHITNGLREIIQTFSPHEAAIEKIIYVQSPRTAIIMGAARGAAIVPVAEFNLPLFEYPAKSAKKSATGVGSAKKDQVQFMIRALLNLTSTPNSDEADALAIAMAHAQSLQNRSKVGKTRVLG